MGSMSAENEAKAQYIAAAVERALKDIGLDATCMEMDAGHAVGVLVRRADGSDQPRAGRFPLPYVSDATGFTTVLPGWEPK